MLTFLIDENLNHRILRGLKRALPSADCIIAQAVGLKGSSDADVLAWASQKGCIW
jgi:hypothetical protein